MGGNYEQVSYSVKNMIANLTGMICDGAKPSCALKLTTGVGTAVMSAMLAMQHKYVTSCEGIIDDDVDKGQPAPRRGLHKRCRRRHHHGACRCEGYFYKK